MPTDPPRTLLAMGIVLGLALSATLVSPGHPGRGNECPDTGVCAKEPRGYHDVDIGPVTIAVPEEWETKRIEASGGYECLAAGEPAVFIVVPGPPVPCPSPPPGQDRWPHPVGVVVFKGGGAPAALQFTERDRVNGVRLIGSPLVGFMLAGNDRLAVDLTGAPNRRIARRIYASVRESS